MQFCDSQPRALHWLELDFWGQLLSLQHVLFVTDAWLRESTCYKIHDGLESRMDKQTMKLCWVSSMLPIPNIQNLILKWLPFVCFHSQNSLFFKVWGLFIPMWNLRFSQNCWYLNKVTCQGWMGMTQFHMAKTGDTKTSHRILYPTWGEKPTWENPGCNLCSFII